MSYDDTPLSGEERAELEQLRAEKRSREERAAQERRQVQEARARGRALMEPGEDLSMPLGQKIVLAGVALVVLVIVLLFVFMPR